MVPANVSQSITRLILAVQDGRDSAVGTLLEVYFDRLVQLARQRLQSLPGMADYDEDVALRSFHSLCQRVHDPAGGAGRRPAPASAPGPGPRVR